MESLDINRTERNEKKSIENYKYPRKAKKTTGKVIKQVFY